MAAEKTIFFLLRKNYAITCSVYALAFKKRKAFRRVTQEG